MVLKGLEQASGVRSGCYWHAFPYASGESGQVWMEMRWGAGQPVMSTSLQAIAVEFQKIEALRQRKRKETKKTG